MSLVNFLVCFVLTEIEKPILSQRIYDMIAQENYVYLNRILHEDEIKNLMLNVLTRNFIVGAPEAGPEAPTLEIDEEPANGADPSLQGKYFQAQKCSEKYSEPV